jgi:hypothetical protein
MDAMSATLEQPGVQGGHGTSVGLAHVDQRHRRLLVLGVPILLGFVLWRLSLLHVDVATLTDYGLPPALPVTWYIALLIGVVGGVTATTAKSTNTLIVLGYIALVIFVLYGTVPVLSAQPHYAWVYKHIGVVRYLEEHGRVNARIDIYNRWPGFFALGAVFSQTNPVSYAGWAELFFILVDAVAVIAAVKVVTRNARIAGGAALLFVVTNWVGQTYYSPQAFAFFLGLALTAIMLRQLKVPSSHYSTHLTRMVTRVGRAAQLPVEPGSATWPRWASIGLVLALDAIIIASHQLTPYMLLISVALLLLAGVIRPWWVVFVMAAMTLAYLAANLHFIEHNYGLFTSIDPFNNIYVEKFPETPTAGKVFNTNVQLLLIACMYVSTLIAAARLLRQGLLMRALPFVLLALAPFALIMGQNYGGEASLRIILFSSPWTGALISWALATVARPRLKWVLAAGVAVAFTALFVPSFLGQEELNIISPAELRTSEWFYSHARPQSVLVLAAPGFPYRYGGTYPEYSGPEGDANPNLLTSRGFQGRQLGPAEVPGVIGRITHYSRYGYIAFTKDEIAYAETLGITPHGALRGLEIALERSPLFRLWHADGDAKIFEMVPGATEAEARAVLAPLRSRPARPARQGRRRRARAQRAHRRARAHRAHRRRPRRPSRSHRPISYGLPAQSL